MKICVMGVNLGAKYKSVGFSIVYIAVIDGTVGDMDSCNIYHTKTKLHLALEHSEHIISATMKFANLLLPKQAGSAPVDCGRFCVESQSTKSDKLNFGIKPTYSLSFTFGLTFTIPVFSFTLFFFCKICHNPRFSQDLPKWEVCFHVNWK
jgi:hypothetical protein